MNNQNDFSTFFNYNPVFEPNPDETLDDLLHGGFVLQKKYGYRFSLDSILLANWAFTSKTEHIADLGCGCGIMPLLLSRRFPESLIVGIEIQLSLYTLAQKNFYNNGVEKQIQILNSDMKSLWNSSYQATFDAVLANPPFFKKGEGTPSINIEKRLARHEETITLPEVFHTAYCLLKRNGIFALILNISRLNEVFNIAEHEHFSSTRLKLIYPNSRKTATMFLWEGVKQSNKKLIVEPPLFIYEENNAYTPDFIKFYGL